ncbi:MAG: DUF3108 domain-containing protein [Bacteroidia bacterium]|nr:DUF3108 domain-containing protein [Bacteroidia bacterium]
MKKIFLFVIAFVLIAGLSDSVAQETLREIKNNAFKPGEVLKFRIHYGFVDAGEATLEVKNEMQNIGGRECYHMVGTGRSVGAFDWFFKVRDRYESIIDQKAMIPWLFVRRVNEGGYLINQNVSFNHYLDSAKSEKATISIPDNTQDLISAFYYARTIDFSKAHPGDIFPITGYLDDAVIPLNIKYLGKENVKTKLGTFQAVKFRPMLQEGRVFKDQEDMTVWISDDKNRIPLRVQTDILVGSIKMDLVGYENLANEPALVKK